MFLHPFKTDVIIRNHKNPLPVNYIKYFYEKQLSN